MRTKRSRPESTGDSSGCIYSRDESLRRNSRGQSNHCFLPEKNANSDPDRSFFNMKLSQARAEAVAQALAAKHGIAAARLKGYGVSSLALVTSNVSEEGRAKNRRVELVKQ